MKLHLDADASIKALTRALREKGHDVTRTPTSWISRDAPDELQLLAASAQGRALFTFNIRDFVLLARVHPHHEGIILAQQSSWNVGSLLTALDRLLREAPDLRGQTVWLNRWRD